MTVDVIAVRIGIPCQIEPHESHSLAIVRRSEQFIDQIFIRIGRSIGEKGVEIDGRRRQSRKIEIKPSSERRFVGLWRRLQAFSLKPCEDETVDRISASGPVFKTRRLRPFRGDEGPMLLPPSPFIDPLPEQCNLLFCQLVPGFRRRHDNIRIFGRNASDQSRFRRIAWHNHAGFDKGSGFGVEAKSGHTLFVVGPMTGETVVRKDRTYLAVEIDLPDLLVILIIGLHSGERYHQSSHDHRQTEYEKLQPSLHVGPPAKEVLITMVVILQD